MSLLQPCRPFCTQWLHSPVVQIQCLAHMETSNIFKDRNPSICLNVVLTSPPCRHWTQWKASLYPNEFLPYIKDIWKDSIWTLEGSMGNDRTVLDSVSCHRFCRPLEVEISWWRRKKVGDVFRALSPAWKEVLRSNTLGAARVITIQRQQWTFL